VNDISEAYENARVSAQSLPTWVLTLWERRATRRAARGTPPPGELARLAAVRSVLRDRASGRSGR